MYLDYNHKHLSIYWNKADYSNTMSWGLYWGGKKFNVMLYTCFLPSMKHNVFDWYVTTKQGVEVPSFAIALHIVINPFTSGGTRGLTNTEISWSQSYI